MELSLTKITSPQNISLYLHIPFCSKLCHYCDFAKTSRYDNSLSKRYFDKLHVHLSQWLSVLKNTQIDSVFLGGGTPSLFTSEYEDTLKILSPHLSEQFEFTIESNPDDITQDNLKVWRDLGINRLSIGVQTFNQNGLAFLTRNHSADTARKAIDQSLRIFEKVNCDMIYGWKNQTLDDWQEDLAVIAAYNVPHLSLYNLTFEKSTPLGRMENRGIITASSDKLLEQMYQLACHQLKSVGFIHDEISNWSKPGHSCLHNWGYWSDRFYLGVGCGAHGYLSDPSQSIQGLRYSYPKTLNKFFNLPDKLDTFFPQMIFDHREPHDWVLEYIFESLRTRKGVDLYHLKKRVPIIFSPNKTIRSGIEAGFISYQNDRIIITELEWFRENYWAIELEKSMIWQSP